MPSLLGRLWLPVLCGRLHHATRASANAATAACVSSLHPSPTTISSKSAIVWPDVANPGPARAANALVVGEALAAGVMRQVAPRDPRVGKRRDGRLRVVAASIADDDQFEVRDRLAQHRRDGRGD